MAPRGRKWKQSEIIDAFKQTHGNTYDYSRVVYTDVDTNVWIGCKKHPKSPLADENGIVWFQQTPHHHIAGEGCPMCNESHGERTIAQLLTTADITYERHKEFEWLPKRCHVDIYLPDYNVAIEYQGELHYLPKFGQAELVKQQQRDSIKKRLCKQNNLPLYEITYKDDIEQKLKEILDSVSGNTVQQTINNTTNESKTNKNMKKNIVKINENTLRQIVADSVKKVLKEGTDVQKNILKSISNKLYEVRNDVVSYTRSKYLPEELSQSVGYMDKAIAILEEYAYNKFGEYLADMGEQPIEREPEERPWDLGGE